MARLFLVACLVLVGVVLVAGHSDHEERIVVGRSGTISDRILGLTPDFDPENIPEDDMITYVLYVTYRFAPMLIIGLATLLAVWPCLLCARCCCGCCGARYSGEGFCCASKDRPAVYTRRSILLSKLLTVDAGILALILAIMLIVASISFSDSLNTFHDTLQEVADNLVERADNITGTLDELVIETNSSDMMSMMMTSDGGDGGDGQDAQQAVEDMEALLKDMSETTSDADGYRSVGAYIAVIVPAVLLIIGAVLGVFNFRKHATCFAVLILVLVSLLWISASVHTFSRIVFTDLCVEFDHTVAKDPEARNPADILTLIGCRAQPGEESPFQGFADDVDTRMEEFRFEVCDLLFNLCNDGSLDGSGCPAGSNETYCSIESIIDQGPNGRISRMNVPGGPSIPACAEDPGCSADGENIHQDAVDIIYFRDSLGTLQDLVDYQVIPLLNCNFLKDQLVTLRQPICGDFLESVKAIELGAVLLCLMLNVGACLLVRGSKRFLPLSQAGPQPVKNAGKYE